MQLLRILAAKTRLLFYNSVPSQGDLCTKTRATEML
jgi:hypothetical protein